MIQSAFLITPLDEGNMLEELHRIIHRHIQQAGKPCDDNELVARDRHIEVLEIVVAGALNDDLCIRGGMSM